MVSTHKLNRLFGRIGDARTNSAVQGGSPGVPNPPWVAPPAGQSADRLGYDGAGRMIAKRYIASYGSPSAIVGFTTTFDRASNKLYERALHAENRSHLYEPYDAVSNFPTGGYDSLDRLLQYQRGTLSATGGDGGNGGGSVVTSIALPNTNQFRSYELDGLGNWRRTSFSPGELAAGYHLDGNALDYSGNGLNGSWTGTASYATGPFAGHQAASFNGSSYITVPSPAPIQDLVNGEFSVSAWVKFASFPSYYSFIAVTGIYDGSGFAFAVTSGPQQLSLTKCGVVDQAVAYPFVADQWYFIAAAQHFSGGQPSYAELFVNGVSIGTFSNTAYYSSAGSVDFLIGHSRSNYVDGLVAEVNLFPFALSAVDVANYWNAGAGHFGLLPQTEIRQHNLLNEITRREGGAVQINPTYDLNGNLTYDGTLTYQWDALNRLAVASNSDETAVGSYFYDALNRRIRKVAGSATTDFIYSGWRCVEDRNPAADGGDGPIAQYVWGRYLDELLQITTLVNIITGSGDSATTYLAGTYFPLEDMLYRTTATVAISEDGVAIVEAYDFDAYGNTLIFNAVGTSSTWWDPDAQQVLNSFCQFLFTGQRFDAETGLYYCKRRMYLPAMGRFLSRDPIVFSAGPNPYYYCGNRPTNTTDPSGTQSFQSPEMMSGMIKWSAANNLIVPAYSSLEKGLDEDVSEWPEAPFSGDDASLLKNLEFEGNTGPWYHRWNDPPNKGGGEFKRWRNYAEVVSSVCSTGNWCCNTVNGQFSTNSGAIRIWAKDLSPGSYEVTIIYAAGLRAARGGTAKLEITPTGKKPIAPVASQNNDDKSTEPKCWPDLKGQGVTKITVSITVAKKSDKTLLLKYEPHVVTSFRSPDSAYAIAVAAFRIISITPK